MSISMDFVSSTLACFENLRLSDLDEGWVSGVTLNDFSPDEELTVSVFADTAENLKNALDICQQWNHVGQEKPTIFMSIDDDDEDDDVDEGEEILFKVLLENCVDMKALLALIYLLCRTGVKANATFSEKLLGVMAAKFYITLLILPGSSAYSVYHGSLLSIVINCLKFPKDQLQKKKRQPASAYRNEVSNQRRRVNRNVVDADFEEFDDETDENENCHSNVSDRDMKEMYLQFADLLVDVITLLKTFSLKKGEETLETVISRIAECISCETRQVDFDFKAKAADLLQTRRQRGIEYCLAALAFKALIVICRPLHGSQSVIFLTVLKHLSNYILCTSAGPTIHQSVRCCRTLIQQLCLRVSEKTDFRAKVANAILVILRHFKAKEYASAVKWITVFVNQTKVSDRMIGLEILSLMLCEPERDGAELSGQLAPFVTPIPIIDEIMGRCSDRAAMVRSKALAILASNLEVILRHLSNGTTTQRAESDGEVSSHSSLSMDSDQENDRNRQKENPDREYTERLHKIARLICRRTGDAKVHSRKSALQGLECLICANKFYLTDDNLKIFQDAARDPNITMKKACVVSISAILHRYKKNSEVQSCWLRSVVPLLLDPEKTVQLKSLEMMELKFLSNMSGSEDEKKCTWSLLQKISSSEHYELQRFLSKAFFIWRKEGKIKPNLRTVLERQIGSEHNAATWLLLNYLSVHVDFKNPTAIVNYWENSSDDIDAHPSLKSNVLNVIGNTCKFISPEKLKAIQNRLEDEISQFNCMVEAIGITVETLFKIYETQCSRQDNYKRIVTSFGSEVMVSSEKFLSALVFESSTSFSSQPEELICRHLFTLGDLALMCPTAVPNKAPLIMQSLIAPKIFDDSTKSSQMSRKRGSQSNQSLADKVPERVQAIAFLTLGKLCLQSEDLTKKCVPALACELANAKGYVIRNNIVIVLADLCRRYTLVIDSYIPSVSACLKDRNSVVRHQTCVSLAKLLQEDYIKFKDSLLYRMLSVVLDDNEKVRGIVEYCLGYTVVKRTPQIFVQNFSNCFYFFNAHPKSDQLFTNFKDDQKLFALKGERNREKRMKLYKFMVKTMDSPKRLTLIQKLCCTVLSEFSNFLLQLDESGESVLKDCLGLLSSDEIKLPSVNNINTDEADDSEVAEACTVKAVQRACLVQKIIPIVVSLKKVLADHRSPLLNDLMIFLREVCRDYKTEVHELFAIDKQLASEVEYDIRIFEEKLEREKHKKVEKEKERLLEEVDLLANATPARIAGIPTEKVVAMSSDRANLLSRRMSINQPIMFQTIDGEDAEDDAMPSVGTKRHRIDTVVAIPSTSSAPQAVMPDEPMDDAEEQEDSVGVAVTPAAGTNNSSRRSAVSPEMDPVVVLHAMPPHMLQGLNNAVSSTPLPNVAVPSVIPNFREARDLNTSTDQLNIPSTKRRLKAARK